MAEVQATEQRSLIAASERALVAAETVLRAARARVAERIAPDGIIDPAALDREQIAAHGLAWMATYVEGLRQIRLWAVRLDAEGAFGTIETLILAVAFGDYLAQLAGGIAMAQGEIARPQDLGLSEDELGPLRTGDAGRLVRGLGEARAGLAALFATGLADGSPGRCGQIGLGDPTLEMIHDQIRRFADRAVAPHAQEWHRRDRLIPIEIIDELARMGVFGMTLPEEHGGLGLGKMAMCVVSEELSRAYIGVGSLGTRSEIAGELIRLGGTARQRQEWLPAIASGKVIPTAVFTEPNTGSDLASLQTRAVKDGDQYRIFGAKTWITHGARSDLMTLLARTGTPESGYRGLSMFLAPKPRGSDADPFPAEGISGTEIPVLGYRGMKEYEIAFDGFSVPAEGLLGGVEGEGFKQLMATFESARVQTASRAVGVAQNALELGLGYALERSQFGKKLIAFPRVSHKLAMMATETMVARQLTYFAAREKDGGRRCDIEAGMAKLLAARVAWSNADNALQIHGGNGYALEYPISRVLCDARILNIFEGAAEIQAQIIARGLLSGRN
jgi:(2S)-methylsuccinyl-CoA dehydrogenase